MFNELHHYQQKNFQTSSAKNEGKMQLMLLLLEYLADLAARQNIREEKKNHTHKKTQSISDSESLSHFSYLICFWNL